jgi:hypothetical protein
MNTLQTFALKPGQKYGVPEDQSAWATTMRGLGWTVPGQGSAPKPAPAPTGGGGATLPAVPVAPPGGGGGSGGGGGGGGIPQTSPSMRALDSMAGPPAPGEGWGVEPPTQFDVPGQRMLPASARALLEMTQRRGGRAY